MPYTELHCCGVMGKRHTFTAKTEAAVIDFINFLDCFVGINTNVPTEYLTVAGNILATGKIGIGASPLSNECDVGCLKDGVLALKETSTPTADANYGKLYTKNDNKIYFQDGAGNEHEIAFV
jgi:hypothetical protein